MITLNVTGMTCGHCEQAVRRALSQVAGVTEVVEVLRERGRVVVDGDADPVALIAAVEEEGYQAELSA